MKQKVNVVQTEPLFTYLKCPCGRHFAAFGSPIGVDNLPIDSFAGKGCSIVRSNLHIAIDNCTCAKMKVTEGEPLIKKKKGRRRKIKDLSEYENSIVEWKI